MNWSSSSGSLIIEIVEKKIIFFPTSTLHVCRRRKRVYNSGVEVTTDNQNTGSRSLKRDQVSRITRPDDTVRTWNYSICYINLEDFQDFTQRVFRVFLATIFRTMDPLFIRISIRKAKRLVTFEKVYIRWNLKYPRHE